MLLLHSARQFVIVLCMLAVAVALTFVRDWMITTNRPKWLINGIEVLSICLFVIDSIVIVSVFAILGFRIVQSYIRDEEI